MFCSKILPKHISPQFNYFPLTVLLSSMMGVTIQPFLPPGFPSHSCRLYLGDVGVQSLWSWSPVSCWSSHFPAGEWPSGTAQLRKTALCTGPTDLTSPSPVNQSKVSNQGYTYTRPVHYVL